MSGNGLPYGADHSLDDPIDSDELGERGSAGEYAADERSTVSDETGTRYDISGETDTTPEDESMWEDAEEL
ncbi:hypothetical protein [Nocardioides speluncae]|uniref:hypothetical protein n=1 Tax=Nocardioides speluncae TaxID=2670337 RepID=UPI0012B166E5|nr:hypothetical protein [Nocardioides speluncae]